MESSDILIHPPPPSVSEPSPPSDAPPSPPTIVLQNGNKYSDSDSESELSDPAEPVAAAASPSHIDNDHEDEHMLDHDDSSTPEPDAERDADYEMELATHTNHIRPDEDHSSSDDSIRPAKRKQHPVEEDDYIRNNPEMYGLRRSTRPRQVHNHVDTSDENDENESDSDVVPPPRKRARHVSQRSSKQHTPVAGSLSDRGDDSDAYGGRRAKLSRKQRRRLLQSAESLTPQHAEIRFSTRRAAKVNNYNEDEDDDMFMEDDETLTPNVWANGQEDTGPAIDMVLNHRLKADITTPTKTKDDYEFRIKWQQKAFYHATWETVESLAEVRSLRRLDNYIRKILMQDINLRGNPDIAPEDREKWILDREQEIDAQEAYSKVERVIGDRDGEDGIEYYVKWKGLGYDGATWEASTIVSEIAQHEIDRYIDRRGEDFRSNVAEINPSSRSSFQPVREQPSYIKGGTLRDFQLTGLNFLAYNWVKAKNVVLADEMGLGKTVQTVAFLSWLRHDRGQQGPFLVAVPLSTMPAWADTFDLWSPDTNYVVYNGNSTARNIAKDYELLPDGNMRHPRFHVLLTTYEYCLSDAAFLSQIKWQFMAVDEAHRLKNRESQLYDRLKEFKAPARLLITGTPVQNNLGELSALFDFLKPGVVNIDENMDLTTEEAGAKIAQLTEDIKPYMLRRTKAKVEKDLPPKTEKIIRVELSDIQLEYYKNILTKNYAALNQGAKGQKQSLLNIMMELKKASNHPFMFPAAEDRLIAADARRDEVLRALVTSSGKMMLLDQLLTKLKRDGHRVLIFSQMVKMLDILGDYMDFRGHTYQRLDGTIAAGPRRIAIDHFNAPESSDFCFLLSTRAGGLGINLMTADTVIIFDSDWNPQADLQAMARAHRIGQVKPVSVYRLVSKETVEEEILERARNKLMLEFLTIQQGVTDKETQARRNALVGEPGSTSEISRILKKRGQKMFEQTDNQKKLEELDLDAVLNSAEDYEVEQPDGTDADGGEEFLKSFDFVDVKVDELSWEDIIPKEHIERIQKEEQEQANAKYLAEVIEQNKPRVRHPQASDDREARKARRSEQRLKDIDSESESDPGPKADPSRPLSEREYRYLIKGHLRYGSIEDRQKEFLEEARLRDRDIGVVRTAMQEVWDKSQELFDGEQHRMAELERTSNRPITKKDRKAVLFELHGVKRINAETILERPSEMRLLKEVTSKDPDFKTFRVPEATKAAGYSCPWGAREDGMLCVGIHRHGYGAWEKIRDDVDLGLIDKFYLEEHRVDKKAERERGDEKNAKSPGAVHLVRRADYLLSVLKSKYADDPAAKRAVENHHRNNKKYHAEKALSSPAPAATTPRIRYRESEKPRHRTVSQTQRESSERYGTPQAERRHGHVKHESESRDHKEHKERRHRDENGHTHHRHGSDHRRSENPTHSASAPEYDPLLDMLFKPVRESLRKIKATTKSAIPDNQTRANELRVLLKQIGIFITDQVAELDENQESVEKRFWDYAAMYWPNKGIKGKELQTIHAKIVASDNKLAGEGSPNDESSNVDGRATNGSYQTSPPR